MRFLYEIIFVSLNSNTSDATFEATMLILSGHWSSQELMFVVVKSRPFLNHDLFSFPCSVLWTIVFFFLSCFFLPLYCMSFLVAAVVSSNICCRRETTMTKTYLSYLCHNTTQTVCNCIINNMGTKYSKTLMRRNQWNQGSIVELVIKLII